MVDGWVRGSVGRWVGGWMNGQMEEMSVCKENNINILHISALHGKSYRIQLQCMILSLSLGYWGTGALGYWGIGALGYCGTGALGHWVLGH